MDGAKVQIPQSFKPLLWSLDWNKLDAWDDIIMAAINSGTMAEWSWINET